MQEPSNVSPDLTTKRPRGRPPLSAEEKARREQEQATAQEAEQAKRGQRRDSRAMLGTALFYLREEEKLTMQNVGDRIGCSREAIRQIEEGGPSINDEKRQKYFQIFGCNAAEDVIAKANQVVSRTTHCGAYGEALRSERESRGWTQKMAAEKFGLDKKTYVKIEHGKETVSTQILQRILDRLGHASLPELLNAARRCPSEAQIREAFGKYHATLKNSSGAVYAFYLATGGTGRPASSAHIPGMVKGYVSLGPKAIRGLLQATGCATTTEFVEKANRIVIETDEAGNQRTDIGPYVAAELRRAAEKHFGEPLQER